MNALRRALARANFERLGIPRQQLLSTLLQWARYQRAIGRIAAERNLDAFPCDYPRMAVQPRRFLYMSCHYGIYAHTVGAVARGSQGHRVCVLVGEQSQQQSELLRAIADRHGCRLDFVQGGFKLLKGARQCLNDGIPLFMLVDVPWGMTDPPDGTFPFLGGTIRTRSVYFRLCGALGLEPYFLLADADRGLAHSTVRDFGPCDQAGLFRLFAEAVADKPFLWDRWFDCHKFTSPERAFSGFLAFRAAGGSYVLDTNAMQLFEVASAQLRLLKVVKAAECQPDSRDKHALKEQLKLSFGRQLEAFL